MYIYIAIGILVLMLAAVLLAGRWQRAKKFKYEIKKLIASGNGNTVLQNVPYEEALKFALQKGAKIDNDNPYQGRISIGFTMKINRVQYSVFFSRTPRDGSVFIGVDTLGRYAKMSPQDLIKSMLKKK